MLPYFKKYTIYVCIIAVALPVVVSTIYPMFTGQIMAASLSGMLIEIGLLFLGMIVGFNIFERRAEARTNELLSYYNDDCDPERLVQEGAKLAHDIPFPCNESGAWYLSTYAQALLDTGNVEGADVIYGGLEQSIAHAKKPEAKAGILVNVVPLAEKMRSMDDTLALIVQGLDLLRDQTSPAATERRQYLNSQKAIFDARKANDVADIIKLDEAVKTNPSYPMRLRVEFAWNEGSAYFHQGDRAKEIECLRFVVQNGGALKLVSQANARLEKLDA